MKLLFDLFPVILFFVAFKYSEKNPELAASWVASLMGSATVDPKIAPILLATVVVILATIAQIIWVAFRHGSPSPVPSRRTEEDRGRGSDLLSGGWSF